jgi:hypothetical protein
MSTSAFCFFLINFQLKTIPGDLVSLTLVNQVADITGTLISGLIYFKLGARKSLILSGTLAGLGSTLLLFVWDINSPRLTLLCILLSKFGSASAFNIVFIDIQILSPTILNSTIFGICNAFARIFASAAPIFAEMDHVTALSLSISLSIVQIILSLFLVRKLPRFI